MILLQVATVKILFMPESTEGVAEGQTTDMGTSITKKTAKLHKK